MEFCEEMANLGKTIIVAALDATFQRKVGVHVFVNERQKCASLLAIYDSIHYSDSQTATVGADRVPLWV